MSNETKVVDATVEENAPQMPPEELLPSIEEVVTKEIVEAIVNGYDDKLELMDYTAELGTKAGDNYMSIMYSVKIDMKDKASGIFAKQIAIMLKTIPRNVVRLQMINESMAFVKEIKMYDQVLKDFVEFQVSKGLPDEEVFRAFPDCYAAVTNGQTDYLALKDLRTEKFEMGNRIKGLDLEHCEIVLQNMAKFHAISYAMFEGDGEKMMEKYPFLEEKMFIDPDKVQENMKMFMSSTYRIQGDLLRKNNLEEEGDLVASIYSDSFWEVMHAVTSSKTKWPVVGHGDCWTNNMLFKYDKQTNKPVSLKFIDFQLARACSRAIDLGYFLHTSPQMEIYNENEEHLLKTYHDSFIDFVSRLGISPEKCEFTFENLLKEYDECRLYGVAMGHMLAPMLTADSSDVPDMEEITEDILTEGKADEFFGDMLKSTLALKKIKNLSQNHLPRCKGFGKKSN